MIKLHLKKMTSLMLVLSTFMIGPAAYADSTSTPTPVTPTPTLEPTYSTTPITITVTGKVTTGTAGLTVPADQTFTLHVVTVVKGKFTETLARDFKLDSSNAFKIDGVIATPGDFEFVTTKFQDVVQGSQLVQVANDQHQIDSSVILYAVTTDASVIKIQRTQEIMSFETGGILQVLASYYFINTSDHLYVSKAKTPTGDQPVSVSIPLPIGATNIAFSTTPIDRFTVGGDMNAPIVEDTKAVVPNQPDGFTFSYMLPYVPKGMIPVDQVYPYETQSIEVLIAKDANVEIGDPYISVTHNGKTPVHVDSAPNLTINEKRPYVQYTFGALNAGADFVYMLGPGAGSVVPRSQVQSEPQQTSNEIDLGQIILIVVGLALAAAGAMVFYQRRQLRRSR